MKKVAFLVLAMIAALPAGAATAEETGEYIFILKARGNPYWQAVVDGINETAKAQGISASVHQLSSDSAAEEQLNLCQAVLARQPKFLAISAVTTSVGIECVKEAAARGIIVADMDSSISIAEADKAGVHLAFSVGSDNYQIGKNAADYLKTIAGAPTAKIFVLEGVAGSIPARKRADGFTDEVRKVLPQAKVIASISADWDRLKAMNVTTDILQREPGLNVIYAANDMMALGAAEALRVAGKTDQISVIGVDGVADARRAVMEGKLTATVAQLPYLIGKRSVEKAVAAVKGEPTEQLEITPTPVLTRQFMESGTDPLLQYVR
ncbi:MAG: substrate-binding domain-containing protein [Alphaproteobacteria bacterium]